MNSQSRERKVVVPIDESEASLRALGVAVERARATGAALHLLNVQPPVASGMVRMFVSQDAIDRYHAEESERAFGPARQLLQKDQVPFKQAMRVGTPHEIIAAYANPAGNDEIVMGSRGMGAIGNLVLGSVATKVIHAARVPVTLVK